MIARQPTMNQGKNRGQATAEFAMAASVFLLVMFAIVKMGMIILAYTSISNAAREAVRYAISAGPNSPSPATDAQVQQVAIDAVPSLALSSDNITVSWPTDPALSTRVDAKVTVAYNYPLSIPFMAKVTVPLSSTARMLAAQ
jgi:Flp pilus assembly protein TadG